MRSSVLFWNHQISQRATVPGWYFLVFITLPAQRNSFWGALPPTVGWSFLQTGSSLPKSDGPASAAIWANCWVGYNDGDLPTYSSHLASSTCFSASSILFSSSLMGEGFLAGDGLVHWGGDPPSSFCQFPPLLLGLEYPPLSTLLMLFGHHFCSSHSIKQTGRCQPKGRQHDSVLVRFCLAAILNL